MDVEYDESETPDDELDIDQHEQELDEIINDLLLADVDAVSLGSNEIDLLPNCRVMTEQELRQKSLSGWNVMENTDNLVVPISTNKFNSTWGPTRDVASIYKSPIKLFHYFLPKPFWLHVMLETNKYKDQMMKKMLKSCIQNNYEWHQIARDIVQKAWRTLQSSLLIANMLCHRKKLRDNWSTTSVGAIGVGTFGQFMKRDRFELISRNLHFTDNMDPRAKSDKAWKVRSIIEVLQTTFKRGYVMGYNIAFDEGMIPSRSRLNKLRQYMKDKPHKWGTKLFLLCCSQTGYCGRLEVYCGKKQHSITDEAIDATSGPQAVVRNLARYFGSSIQVHRRMVAMDRFYTSVALSQKLNGMGFDSVGTI
ncbi:hypothetical protein AeMF1_014350, partial [Aphanomyces euteiches]